MTSDDVKIFDLNFDSDIVSSMLYDGDHVFQPKGLNAFQYADLAFIVNESDYEDEDELNQVLANIIHRRYKHFNYQGCEDTTEDFKEGGIWY